jgi:hypothetical protein
MILDGKLKANGSKPKTSKKAAPKHKPRKKNPPAP